MKADILDVDALRAISPIALAGFARSEGWQKVEPFGTHSDIYAGTEKPEIILPRTARLGDYPSVVAQLIGIFARTLDSDELSTYRELTEADRDIVRIRASNADDDGSIAIDAGVELIAQAKDLVLAAACAARSPQSLYRAGANREAVDYLKRVRLGQTEQGSYVVTLLAPMPPLLQAPAPRLWPVFEDEPFERQVTRRLAESLEALRIAVELASSGDGEAFEHAIPSGVSANLCEAVAGLASDSRKVEISLSWAKTRPAPENRSKVTFSESDASILTEAARIFRSRHPQPDVTLFGTVHTLKRRDADIQGLVTLKAVIDNKPQSVRAVLDQANYSIAVQAHESRTPIVVKGDLERIGQRWQLTSAQIGSLAGTEEEDEIAEDNGAVVRLDE